MGSEVTVRASGVTKKFSRTLEASMRYGLADVARAFVGMNRSNSTLRPGEFWALREVDFALTKGERLGLLGRNGSGKTTLLRIIAGLMPPDEGQVITRGTSSAVLGLGAGFHPHMSGRENIYVNAALVGMTRAEIDDECEGIIEFTGLGDAIDTPVSMYSSGMRMRLGFAVATSSKPDILILDEGLSVGDLSFRDRSLQRIEEMTSTSTVVLVAQNPRTVRASCSRAMVLDAGRIRLDGDVDEVCDSYAEMLRGPDEG